MQCPSCGLDNPEGMKFCGECGAPFKYRCPRCGFDNPPRFKFCRECGTSLTAQSHPPVSSFEFQVSGSQSPAPKGLIRRICKKRRCYSKLYSPNLGVRALDRKIPDSIRPELIPPP